jgi:hypothetical protein
MPVLSIFKNFTNLSLTQHFHHGENGEDDNNKKFFDKWRVPPLPDPPLGITKIPIRQI